MSAKKWIPTPIHSKMTIIMPQSSPASQTAILRLTLAPNSSESTRLNTGRRSLRPKNSSNNKFKTKRFAAN